MTCHLDRSRHDYPPHTDNKVAIFPNTYQQWNGNIMSLQVDPLPLLETSPDRNSRVPGALCLAGAAGCETASSANCGVQ